MRNTSAPLAESTFFADHHCPHWPGDPSHPLLHAGPVGPAVAFRSLYFKLFRSAILREGFQSARARRLAHHARRVEAQQARRDHREACGILAEITRQIALVPGITPRVLSAPVQLFLGEILRQWHAETQTHRCQARSAWSAWLKQVTRTAPSWLVLWREPGFLKCKERGPEEER